MPHTISKNGMSMLEILVVAALASLVLLSGTIVMNRTTGSFKKGTDMLNTQVLMDFIVERLRSDVRALYKINSVTPDKFSFVSIENGTEKEVVYEYDSISKTLTRKSGSEQTDFHGPHQVEAFMFQAVPSLKNFKYLNVAMQLKSDIKGEGAGSSLSIVCQFHSKCLEPSFDFGR